MITDYENRISLEDWADEILKRRDQFDDEYVYEITDFAKAVKSVKRNYFKELEKIEEERLDEGKSKPKILADLITAVSKYLIDTATFQDDKEALIQALRFYKLSKNIFVETHGKTYRSFSRGEELGLFVLALKLKGSSVKQAKESVATWAKMSVTKVESYYTQIKNKDKESWDSFYWINSVELASVLLRFKDEEFPNSNVSGSPKQKTFQAFKKVKADVIEHYKDPDHYGMMPIRTLHLGIDWNEYDKFRQKIIALN